MPNEKESVNEQYRTAIQEYRNVVTRAFVASRKSHRARCGEQGHWASIIFLRLCLIGGSISRLCPDIDKAESNIWDFASIAALSRTLFEWVIFFIYFTEDCDEEEWLVKLKLMLLHDRSERIIMLTRMALDSDVAGLKDERDEFRQQLDANPFFQKLDPKRQTKLRNGKQASIWDNDEMRERFGTDPDDKAIFKFLSNFTHGQPVSFTRTFEQRRTGLETETDKIDIAMSLGWIAPVLDRAIHQYERTVFGTTPASLADQSVPSGG